MSQNFFFSNLLSIFLIVSFFYFPLIAESSKEASMAEKELIKKGFSKKWIQSLTQRGKKDVFSECIEIKHIGMPIGGLFSGLVYLGGDGDLWLWDILNKRGYSPGSDGGGKYYSKPMIKDKYERIEQYFTITTDGYPERKLTYSDKSWNIKFNGQYPIGTVDYSDEEYPIKIQLKAYSPFIPTDDEDSGLPATILEYSLYNNSSKTQKATLTSYLQNISCYFSKPKKQNAFHKNKFVKNKNISQLILSSFNENKKEIKTAKQDILFESFEAGNYDKWTVKGDAFGKFPFVRTDFASYHNVSGHEGTVLVNSHNTRITKDGENPDELQGEIISEKFKISRNYISFLVGGGAHKGKTEIQLLVNGEVVQSASGNNSNRMFYKFFDLKKYLGQEAQIRIIDFHSGTWGHIGVDNIVFTDTLKDTSDNDISRLYDYGNMTISLLDDKDIVYSVKGKNNSSSSVTSTIGEKLVGSLGKKITLKPKQTKTVKFIISWYFPNIGTGEGAMRSIKEINVQSNYYAKKFKSSSDVGKYIEKNYDYLSETTKKWVKTWYDSTLPYWFLDRTFLNVSTLASTVWHRFYNPQNPNLDGRAYCWEGGYLGDGSCTHVLHYEQAMGRVFPNVTKQMREKVDYGFAFNEKTGHIKYRAEFSYGAHRGFDHAVDGHAGTILRMFREYTMTYDKDFLKRNWRRIKKSIYILINQDKKDKNGIDGILETRQYNTLDRIWYGKIPWISGLYNAVLLAGESMAKDMGDTEFEEKCKNIAAKGKKSLDKLFNGEYFIHEIDKTKPRAPSHNIGCHSDQLLGQYWAKQNNLNNVFTDKNIKKTLESIFSYNFENDVGVYQKKAKIKAKRFFGLPGESGLIMCTFPKGIQKTKYAELGVVGGYFSEVWTSMEYTVGSLMIDNGMVTKGLALMKAAHDRYAPSKRNPYNEIEYGNHYTRAMASYAPFVSISGFKYHAPKRMIGFAPKLTPENFKSAFITGKSWGTYQQSIKRDKMTAKISVQFGELEIKKLLLSAPFQVKKVQVNGKSLSFNQEKETVEISLEKKLLKGKFIEVKLF